MGIRGNLAADSAAKDALVGNTLVELIPLSDLRSHANKCIVELWQSEWDELLGNKLHKIFPVLKQCVVCPWTNKRRNCDIPIAHWPFFYPHSFLLKGEEPPMCIRCDELLTIEHILLTCSHLIEIRENCKLNHCMCYSSRFHIRRFLTF